MGTVADQESPKIDMISLISAVIFSLYLMPSWQQEQISAIPGAPGRDYPDYTKVPRTSFTCAGLSPGFYSDPEGECQVYHHCQYGVDKPSFTRLCPIGPLYNQQYFTCDWWFNVDCSTVEEFYSLNDENYAAAAEAGRR